MSESDLVHEGWRSPPKVVGPRERIVRIGADIGQRRDPSAIVTAELELRKVKPGGWDSTSGDYYPPKVEAFYVVRHVQRMPLGTPYPAIAGRIAQIVESVQKITDDARPMLLMDATGVGRPIVDLVRQALLGFRYQLYAVTFTGGEKLRGGPGRWDLSVGKAYLVSRMQALLQTGHLRFPDTDEARTLADELLNYEIRVTAEANVQAGAFRGGTHDDLATALGLAVLLPVRTRGSLEIL